MSKKGSSKNGESGMKEPSAKAKTSESLYRSESSTGNVTAMRTGATGSVMVGSGRRKKTPGELRGEGVNE